MENILLIAILMALGVALLILEIFIPSHGILTLGGLGFLAAGVVMIFRTSETAGYITLLLLVVALPVLAVTAVKVWPRTPIGRRIVAPNPQLTEEDTGELERQLAPFIGRTGRTLTPLRPSGYGLFDGRRVPCVAEIGMIESGVEVEAIAIRGRALCVRPIRGPAET